MNSIEFGKKCHSYNIKYRDIFGYVPCKDDYSCTQEEFMEALVKSIKDQKEIDTFLARKTYDSNSMKKY